MEKGKTTFVVVLMVILVVALASMCILYITTLKNLNLAKQTIAKTEANTNSVNTSVNTNTNTGTTTNANTSTNTSTSNITSTTTCEDKIPNLKLSSKNFVQALDAGGYKVIIDKTGDVYLHYDGAKDTADTTIQSYLKLETEYAISDIKGFEYLPGYTSISAYKLNISNVVCGFTSYIGNSGILYVFFIDANGKLAYINVNNSANSITNIHYIDGLKNVVSVLRSDNYNASNTYAVLNDGSMVDIYPYLTQSK